MIDGAVMDSELSPVSGGQGSALRSRRLETSVESVTRTPRHSPELQPSPYLSQTILPTDRSGQTEKLLAECAAKLYFLILMEKKPRPSRPRMDFIW